MNTPRLEEWRRVWRDGIAPCLTTEHLEALAKALESDDPRLTQGSTTTPPALMCIQDWPCEAACALGFCGVVENGGFGVASVGAAEAVFGRLCFESDQRTGQPTDVRHFLNAWDDLPRGEIFPAVLEEVRLELTKRAQRAAA